MKKGITPVWYELDLIQFIVIELTGVIGKTLLINVAAFGLFEHPKTRREYSYIDYVPFLQVLI